MKTKLIIAALTFGVTLLTLSSTQAQNTVPPAAAEAQKEGKHHKNGAKQMDELTKELNLTADQQAKVKEVFKESQPQMKALHEDTTLAPKERHGKMKAIHEATQAKVRALLTAEQATKYDEFVAKQKAEHGKKGKHN